MLYIVTELLFLDSVTDAHCWTKIGVSSYQQQFSENIALWRTEFVKIYGPHNKR